MAEIFDSLVAEIDVTRLPIGESEGKFRGPDGSMLFFGSFGWFSAVEAAAAGEHDEALLLTSRAQTLAVWLTEIDRQCKYERH